MPQEYKLAPEVELIANKIIYDHHSHLSGARIVYVFLAEAPVVKGREAMGRARVITGINAWLSTDEIDRESEPTPYFLIEISRKHWEVLSEAQRRALVDHELSHCDVDEETSKPKILGHDVEEFSGVIRRHGLWRYDVESFVKTGMEAMQRRLPLDGESAQTEPQQGDPNTVTISTEGEAPITVTMEDFSRLPDKIRALATNRKAKTSKQKSASA